MKENRSEVILYLKIQRKKQFQFLSFAFFVGDREVRIDNYIS